MKYSRGDFPKTEKIAREIVSLPMFPQLTDQQQARVAESILQFLENGAALRRSEAVVLGPMA